MSVDGIYFGGLLFVCVVYWLHFMSTGRYCLDKPMVIHLLLLMAAATTVLWSPGKITGLREVGAMVYVWLFHFFFRNTLSSKSIKIYKYMLTFLAVLLLLTYLSILAGWLSGVINFSPDDELEISDIAGYFIMPIDLVSIIVFFSLTLIITGNRRPVYYLLFISSVLLLLLNFSKTYMFATIMAVFAYWLVRHKSVWGGVGILFMLSLPAVALVLTSNPVSRQLFFDKEMTIGRFLSAPDLYWAALNTSGRLNIWDYLLTQSFSGNGYWFGAGLGATREILSRNPFGEAGFAAHSDYVRILADFGVFGIMVYLTVLFVLMRRYVLLIRQARDRSLQVISGGGFMMTIYTAIGGIGYEMLNRPRSLLLVYVAILGISYALENRLAYTHTQQ